MAKYFIYLCILAGICETLYANSITDKWNDDIKHDIMQRIRALGSQSQHAVDESGKETIFLDNDVDESDTDKESLRSFINYLKSSNARYDPLQEDARKKVGAALKTEAAPGVINTNTDFRIQIGDNEVKTCKVTVLPIKKLRKALKHSISKRWWCWWCLVSCH